MNSRRALIILGVIVLLVIVGAGLYFLLLAPKAPGGTQAGGTGTLPAAGTQNNPGQSNTTAGGAGQTANTPALGKNFGVISNEPVLNYFVSPSNVVTAIESTGKIIQVTGGQVTTLSELQLQNILSASFSHDGMKILVNFGGSSNPQTSIFDVATKAWIPLATGLQSPVWAPTGYRIAYQTSKASNGTESIATLDAAHPKTAAVPMFTVHAQDLSIAWVAANQLVLYTQPSAYVDGSSLLFDVQKGTLTPIALETSGLETLWGNAMPTSTLGLEFSAGTGGRGGFINLIDLKGAVIQPLKILTLPSKCLFASASSSPYLFCGIPRDQSDFSIDRLPDDYNQMALFTTDDIYRIDLQTGTSLAVFNDATQNLDVTNVKFSNGTLFFVNRYDNKLYAISL